MERFLFNNHYPTSSFNHLCRQYVVKSGKSGYNCHSNMGADHNSMCVSSLDVERVICLYGMYIIERKFSTVLHINYVPLSLFFRISEILPNSLQLSADIIDTLTLIYFRKFI